MPEEYGELMVYKSNDLIQQSKFSLTKTEMQIVNYIIAKIDSPKYNTEFNSVVFDVKEFYSLLNISDDIGGSAYDHLKRSIKKLADKSIWLPISKKEESLIRWIEKPVIDKENGTITIKLDDDMKPYLLNMNVYMKTLLRYTFEMTSKYSIRLYELLKSWEKVKDGEKTFDLDELKIRIDADKKAYDNFGRFRQSVLDPAVQEINEVTDLSVSYEPKKRGRKVVSVLFHIAKKSSNALIYDENQLDINTYLKLQKEIKKEEAKDAYLRQYSQIIDAVLSLQDEFPKLKPESITEAYIKELVGICVDVIPAKYYFDFMPEERYELFARYIYRQAKHVNTINSKKPANNKINDPFAYLKSACIEDYAKVYRK